MGTAVVIASMVAVEEGQQQAAQDQALPLEVALRREGPQVAGAVEVEENINSHRHRAGNFHARRTNNSFRPILSHLRTRIPH